MIFVPAKEAALSLPKFSAVTAGESFDVSMRLLLIP
jgi:hypothetical protein